MGKKKVGLALGSGVSRGLAHIGVLEVLEKERIPIDIITGTSVGAIIGALYARDQDISMIREFALSMSKKRLVSFMDLRISRDGFIQGKNIKRMLETTIGSRVKFSDLKIPFACIATDIITGEEVILNQGLLLESVRASISIPVIFALAKLNGRYLVDGQLVNPVPVDILSEMGADFIIAVNVIPNLKAETRQTKKLKMPNIFDVITNSIDIANDLIVRHSLEGADIIIEPDVGYIGVSDFHRVEECIQQGEKATKEAIQKIKLQLYT